MHFRSPSLSYPPHEILPGNNYVHSTETTVHPTPFSAQKPTSALLDPSEPAIITPRTSYRDYLTARNPDLHAKIHDAYMTLDAFDGKHRIERLRQCRRQAYFAYNPTTGAVKVTSNACRLRWCPLCAAAKHHYLTEEIKEWIHLQPTLRFLTLTTKHSSQPLAAQLDDLYSHFRQLRRSPFFKRYVKGGIWFLQTHLSPSDGCWHNHLHCIITGRYFPENLLKALWLSITQKSHIVNIKLIEDKDKAAEHVARYAVNPCPPQALALQPLIELMQACHGRRICGTWGTARGVNLAVQSPPDAKEYRQLGSFTSLISEPNPDLITRDIIYAWRNNVPLSPSTLAALAVVFSPKFAYHRKRTFDPGLFQSQTKPPS